MKIAHRARDPLLFFGSVAALFAAFLFAFHSLEFYYLLKPQFDYPQCEDLVKASFQACTTTEFEQQLRQTTAFRIGTSLIIAIVIFGSSWVLRRTVVSRSSEKRWLVAIAGLGLWLLVAISLGLQDWVTYFADWRLVFLNRPSRPFWQLWLLTLLFFVLTVLIPTTLSLLRTKKQVSANSADIGK